MKDSKVPSELSDEFKKEVEQNVKQLPHCAEVGAGGVLLPFPYWLTLFKIITYLSQMATYKYNKA